MASEGAQVRSPAWHSGLKDMALPQLWGRLQLQLRIQLLVWELPYAMGVAKKKKLRTAKTALKECTYPRITLLRLSSPTLLQEHITSERESTDVLYGSFC